MIVEPGLLDRAGELRDAPGIVDGLRAEPSTRVIVVHDRRARVADAALLRVSPADVVGARDWALLGRDPDGTPVLLAVVEDAPVDTVAIDAVPADPAPVDAARWSAVRDAGGVLAGVEAELLIEAVAVADWLTGFRFCPACGAETELRQAGWSRHCPSCGREHFPRTDPAVIVAIESADGERLLLGANANWQGRMYSTFAGFLEAGESLETTVHREIFEEAGVRLQNVRYVSSQPWPYPRSLMLGFRATAVEEDAVADGAEIIDVRWLTRAEIATALQGEGPVGLPGPSSIARALIVDWYEEGACAVLSERRPEQAQRDEGTK
ncbi:MULTISPECIES: NAD(+) diphosphatase [unclassified Microbacterium]|uniref:NAD(+) diphosphatase n=1 Tax=unclassified Microbacterium TaxID=2609290 RepID=UPI0012FC327C|nr:NAD(+) diphosphatase [Microbacterium sp. MAH-37]MVQ41863.1 NAD(+) diphosphatase [Microbacterium sp. MAH-37]